MNPKIKKILTIVMTALAAGLVILSGVMKFMQSAEVVETLNKVGVGSYIIGLGTMEIVFALLFLYPKTMKIGFVLLSCYFAGALATELSHGTPLNAFMPIILVWIAAFLRDRRIFLATE
ncbi:DoxX family protein [Spirosoma sp. SC4-14]|uniref:DoxX family protein n=1 Tax=Spirosoma sp. SC4-14 TaxID=3128900 RepID=UPI0030D3D105